MTSYRRAVRRGVGAGVGASVGTGGVGIVGIAVIIARVVGRGASGTAHGVDEEPAEGQQGAHEADEPIS